MFAADQKERPVIPAREWPFGSFASYADTQYGHIVTVVFLQGGRQTYSPKAEEISGKFYRALYDHNFFAQRATTASGSTAEKPAVGVQQ